MEFITDNLIWIIIFGVIILMAIIGFIAEKTNFVGKSLSKTDAKKEEFKKEKKQILEDRRVDTEIETLNFVEDVEPNHVDEETTDIIENVSEGYPVEETFNDESIGEDNLNDFIKDDDVEENKDLETESIEDIIEIEDPITESTDDVEENNLKETDTEDDVWKF